MGFLTWLDWYASGAAEKLGAGCPRHLRGTDADALGTMAMAYLTEMTSVKDDWDETTLAQFTFFGAIASFCPPPNWRDFEREFKKLGLTNRTFAGGQGLKLSRRLVQAFAHAKAPQTTDWQELAVQHGWYFDLPHHALLIGDAQVRAILTHPDTLSSVAAVAILTAPGSDEMIGRYAWMLVGDNDRPTGSSATDTDIDPLELQRRANDFVILALLYYRSLEHCELLPRRQTGPHLSKIQQRLDRKTKSLFVVHNLPDPVGNLGRPVDPAAPGDAKGWRLDHRVTVRGHFRWQPVGEGRSRRELRWIAEHLRGADLPDKPHLIPLRRPNR